MNLSIPERIKREKAQLLKIYAALDPDRLEVAKGLIDRAAWMRVECEELEVYLVNNGWTEPFQQSNEVATYDRARPQGQAYQSLNSNYQKILRQLDSMLPDRAMHGADDGFDCFASRRDHHGVVSR